VFLSNGQIVPAQVDTLADRTPIFADASYYSTSALELLGSFAAYSAIYKSQVWVGIVIRKLAMATSRMPFEFKIRLDDTDSKDEAGPLTELLARPNPRMSGNQLKRWTSSTQDIYGEAFWLKLRDQKGRVRELHPIHPTNLIARRNMDGVLEYFYSSGLRSFSELPPIPEEDIVPFLNYNPDNLVRGLSNLESLRMTLFNEDAARRAMASMWKNNGRPGIVLQSDNALSDKAIARLSAQTAAAIAGADNTGKTFVLEEGLKANIIQLNSEEMQYIESRKLGREEVCAGYDVPPPVVHILDHATFSNISEQLRSQYRDTMAPRFVSYESVIDHHLVPDFYSDRSVYSRFNMEDVLRGDFEAKATAAVSLRNAGLITGNQGVGMFGYPRSEDPNMDKYFANAALVELGTPAQKITITEAAKPTPAMDAEATETAQGGAAASQEAAKQITRSLMGRVSRKSNKKDIRASLIAGHQVEMGKFFDRQRASVKANVSKKAAGVFDPTAWNTDLATILHSLSTGIAKALGTKVASDLGGTYDGTSIVDYLKTNSESTAKQINDTTAKQIEAAFAANSESIDGVDPEAVVDGLFDGELAARSDQISETQVAVIGGLAGLVAARLSDAKTKTWITGPNPRPSHAEMDGEEVALGELFSNGMDGPGDFNGGADEVAGCNCDLEFSTGG
jgi:HK97 family phage portal protein